MQIVIDFDGTCVKHAYPYIGEDIGSQKVLKKLVDKRHQLILFTMRSGNYLEEAIKWFEKNQISLFGIQTNPEQIEWTSSPKAYGQLYIDDCGLGCPLIYNQGERPYVDWDKVELFLEEKQII